MKKNLIMITLICIILIMVGCQKEIHTVNQEDIKENSEEIQTENLSDDNPILDIPQEDELERHEDINEEEIIIIDSPNQESNENITEMDGTLCSYNTRYENKKDCECDGLWKHYSLSQKVISCDLIEGYFCRKVENYEIQGELIIRAQAGTNFTDISSSLPEEYQILSKTCEFETTNNPRIIVDIGDRNEDSTIRKIQNISQVKSVSKDVMTFAS